MENTFMIKANLSCISKERLQEINSAKWVEGEIATPTIGEVILLSAIALIALELVSTEAEANHDN